MSLIEVENLEKIYSNGDVETVAIRGISFNIEKGEFVAIMGPSGSGKSTLLHMLGFLDKPTKGKYSFDGKTVKDYLEEEVAEIRNKKMGFVFQAFNLLSKTTVLENVKLPLFYSNIKESLWNDMAMKAIESVGLAHKANSEQSRLSGGERQRVAIARALVNNPSVVFADEPTGNLDSKSGKSIIEIIQKLNKEENRTIILITHEDDIAEYAKRIIGIKDGVIEYDNKKQL